MNQRLIVATPQAAADARLREAVASLPETLTVGPAALAEVAAVDGSAGWPTRIKDAAARSRGAMLFEPVPADAEPLLDSESTVAVRWRYGSDAVLARLADEIAALGRGRPVECRVEAEPDSDPESVFVSQIALVSRVLREQPLAVRVLHRSRRGYHAVVTFPGTSAHLDTAITAASAPQARLRLIDDGSSVNAVLPSGSHPRPDVITVLTTDGAKRLPTSWESRDRAAWRRLAGALGSGERLDDLSLLCAISRVIRTDERSGVL